MSRITVVHNPHAGDGAHERQAIVADLQAAGHRVDYHATTEGTWKAALKQPGDLVLVAGGDGTVHKVARRLRGSGVPLAVLALGTANNIATGLGSWPDVGSLLAGLSAARWRPFDLGVATGPWGERPFLEAWGVGVFTDVMTALTCAADADPAARSSIPDALQALRDALARPDALDLDVAIDGQDASGRYVLLEAMNTPHLGPNLALAPDADPSDGLLDVVLMTPADRAELDRYLAARIAGAEPPPPRLPVRQGRELTLTWNGATVSLDDKSWPDARVGRKEREAQLGARITIAIEPGALKLLVPA